MTDTMNALVLHAVGDLRCEESPVPALKPGWARVRVAAAGVCGSDVPRVFHHGTYRMPLIPGHELAGVVDAVGTPTGTGTGDEEVAGRVGERVTIFPLIPCRKCAYCEIGAYGQCTSYDYLGSRTDGGFADYVLAPLENLVRVPDAVTLAEAALTEPAAVALHALRQGDATIGDRVVVLGAGPIGMMIAQWAMILGARQVMLVDIDARKLELASSLRLGETCNAREGDPVDWVKTVTGGRGADLVIEAAGAPQTFEQALRMTRPLGRVVMMGNPAGDVRLPQATVSQLLRKQLTVRGTWNSSFAAVPLNEWEVVLDMLAAGRLHLSPLISHRVPLSAGPAALRMMHDQSDFFNRVVIVNEVE
jgi:L-iditol 2-dehydrogenase